MTTPESRMAARQDEAVRLSNRTAAAQPRARQLADERGIYLVTLRGTGPNGTVTRKDVEDYRDPYPMSGAAALARMAEPLPGQLPDARTDVASGAGDWPGPDRLAVASNAEVHGADPAARVLANQHSVLLRNVSGTGRGGRVTAADVHAHVGRDAAARERQEAAARALSAPAAIVRPVAYSPPAFTASGIDPKALLQVPAPVRPAMAAAATTAEAFALLEKYRGLSDEAAEQLLGVDHTVAGQHGGWDWPTGR